MKIIIIYGILSNNLPGDLRGEKLFESIDMRLKNWRFEFPQPYLITLGINERKKLVGSGFLQLMRERMHTIRISC